MRCRYRSSQSDSGLRCCGFIEPKASSRRIDRGQQYFEPGHWVRDVTGPILQHLSLGCPFAGCGTLGQAARHVFVQHAGNGCLVRDAFFPRTCFESGQFALGGNRLQLPFLKGFPAIRFRRDQFGWASCSPGFKLPPQGAIFLFNAIATGRGKFGNDRNSQGSTLRLAPLRDSGTMASIRCGPGWARA